MGQAKNKMRNNTYIFLKLHHCNFDRQGSEFFFSFLKSYTTRKFWLKWNEKEYLQILEITSLQLWPAGIWIFFFFFEIMYTKKFLIEIKWERIFTNFRNYIIATLTGRDLKFFSFSFFFIFEIMCTKKILTRNETRKNIYKFGNHTILTGRDLWWMIFFLFEIMCTKKILIDQTWMLTSCLFHPFWIWSKTSVFSLFLL